MRQGQTVPERSYVQCGCAVRLCTVCADLVGVALVAKAHGGELSVDRAR